MTLTNGTQQPAVVHYSNVLAQNKSESTSPTPVVIKSGNFRVQADVTLALTAGSASVQFYLYVIFIPQGMVPASSLEAQTLIRNHPEWVMGWKLVDTTPTDNLDSGFNKVTISSRLKRNLNSGDSVYVIGICPELPSTAQIDVKGLCQFWTCAN